MKRKLAFSFLILGIAFIIACGGSTSTPTPTTATSGSGNLVIMGTDYPTTSNVISFVVPISGITLSGSSSSSVSVLGAPTSINFSALVGLRSLITVQPATQGTYTSATITFGGNPTLSILNTTVSPPTVTTLPAEFSSNSVTVNFPTAEDDGNEQVTQSNTLGMMLDFDLDKSIPVDSSGNIAETNGTVQVTPVITLHFLHQDSDKFDIDEMRGGVVSVGSDGSFVIQTADRSQYTITTDSNTLFEPSGQSFSTLSTNDLVEIEDSTMDPQTLSIKAKEVDVFPDNFMVSGLVTLDNPPAAAGSTTCASTVSFLVRDALPADASPGFPEDQIADISLAGTEKYFFVHEMDDILSSFGDLAFNSCSIVPGQALTIGGSVSGSTLTPAQVMLAKQGFSGTAASSISNGTFTFNAQGLAGTLLPSPVTVETLQSGDFNTDFESGSGGVAAGTTQHVAGLVLYNNSTKTTNVFALRIVPPGQD